MMYKVMVVDDKLLIRKSIITTVDWESISCEISGESANGIEAYNKINRESPDIIIADIKMPGMDGLELSTRIIKEFPNIKIILITGFHEFEYAQKALKLGVTDLISKPLDNLEIIDSVKKAINEIEEKKHNSQKELKNMKRDKKQFLLDSVRKQGYTKAPEFLKKSKEMFPETDYFFISVINANNKSNFENLLIKSFEIANKKTLVNYLILDNNGKQRFLVFVNKGIRNNEIKEYIISFSNNINNNSDQTFVLAYSSIYHNHSEIECAYTDIEKIEGYHYFIPNEKIISPFNTTSPNTDKVDLIHNLQAFYESIEHLTEAECRTEINKIAKLIMKKSRGDCNVAKKFFTEICITSFRIYVSSTSTSELSKTEMINIINQIENTTNINSAKSIIMNYIIRLWDMEDKKRKKLSPLAKMAVEYTKDNFSDPQLSLKLISDTLRTNSSYLSRIIKKETGKNFISILTEFRIKEIKRMLRETNFKLDIIAEKAGYVSYSYMYQVFKKTTGISPNEYKNQIK